MEDPFDSIEQEREAVVADRYLRSFEKKYFAGVRPVRGVEFVSDPTFASRYHIPTETIQINAGVARFPRLVQFLMLHELVHHKLVLQNPDYAKNPYGDLFRKVTHDLVGLGAYDELL